MFYLPKKKSMSIVLAIIILLSNIGISVNANKNNLTGWKKTYYDFMTDYTRLYPDMNSEVIKSGDFGNPDFINGRRTDSEDLYPLYHKTENLKLVNLTDNPIPEIISFTYGNFTGDWIGSSTNDTNIEIYKYENGKLEKIYESYQNLLDLYYRETEQGTDIIVRPGYPQYDYGHEPKITNLVWDKKKKELESIIDEELTNTFYGHIEGRSDPNYLPNYFEDRGYHWLYYINNSSNDMSTNTIQIEDRDILVEGDTVRKHYIEYIDKSEIRSMLDEFPDNYHKEQEPKENTKADGKDKDIKTESQDEGSKENIKSHKSGSLWNNIVAFLKNLILEPLTVLFSNDKDNAIDRNVSDIRNKEEESVEEIEKESKEDLDLDYESSKEGFRTYVNNKYGYTIDYPSSFEKDNSKEELPQGRFFWLKRKR